MKNNRKKIVIDADIACSAGLSVHPISSSSRVLLDCVFRSEMVIVLGPTLLHEWHEHRSGYATRWLSSMMARRRVLRVDPPQAVMLAIIDALGDVDSDIANKDSHIVDAAISCHAIIASNDTKARAVFGSVVERYAALRQVVWCVPRIHGPQLNDLFNSGAAIPVACLLTSAL